MLAITISCAPDRSFGLARAVPTSSLKTIYPWRSHLLIFTLFLLLTTSAFAQSPASEPRARHAYNTAGEQFSAAKTNSLRAWQFGRAAFDLAEILDDNEQGAIVAGEGADACRAAIALDPTSAPAHYYLALNLGQIARTKKLGALRILREMERELLTASRLDPKFDHGGPDRSLGILYREAPSWPASIGNRNRARTYLESALRIDPDYPDNHICMAEAYAQWGESKNLEAELKTLDQLMVRARSRFDPIAWQADWREWQARVAKLRKAHDEISDSVRPAAGERGAKSIR